MSTFVSTCRSNHETSSTNHNKTPHGNSLGNEEVHCVGPVIYSRSATWRSERLFVGIPTSRQKAILIFDWTLGLNGFTIPESAESFDDIFWMWIFSAGCLFTKFGHYDVSSFHVNLFTNPAMARRAFGKNDKSRGEGQIWPQTKRAHLPNKKAANSDSVSVQRVLFWDGGYTRTLHLRIEQILLKSRK